MKYKFLIYIAAGFICVLLAIPATFQAWELWFEIPAIPAEVTPPPEEDILPPDPEEVALRDFPYGRELGGSVHANGVGVVVKNVVNKLPDGEYEYQISVKNDCDKTVWVHWHAFEYYFGGKLSKDYTFALNTLQMHPGEEYRVTMKHKSKPTFRSGGLPCLLSLYYGEPDQAESVKEMFEYAKGPKIEKFKDGEKQADVEGYRWWMFPTSSTFRVAYPEIWLDQINE